MLDNKEKGFVKTYRSIWDNPVSNKPAYFSVWMYLLSHANFIEKETIINNKKITIKRGEFIGSLRQISQHFSLSISTVKYIIDYFVSEHMIEHKPNSKFSLFKVNKYDYYNDVEQEVVHKKNTNKTQIKTTNKDKKEKNEKNIPKGIEAKPQEFGNPLINKLTDELKSFNNVTSLDGTVGENRQYAHNLIRCKIKPEFKSRQNTDPSDEEVVLSFRAILNNAEDFHRKNLTNFKYVYYNFAKLIKNNSRVIDISHL